MLRMMRILENIFRIESAGSSVRRECIAGLTTFAAMAYILAVNPIILSDAGMPREPLITVTAIAAAIGCLLMAGLANYPIALAPGMGTNAYFTYVICIGMGVPWQAALSLTLWNGVLFLLLSLSGLRRKLAESLPDSIKIGITAGIGIFIAFIGLKNVGIVVGNDATLVSVGNLTSPGSILVLLGLVLMLALILKRLPGAILIGILAVTLVSFFIPSGGKPIGSMPESIVSWPAGIGELFLAVDWLYPIREFSGETLTVLVTLFVLDLFDSMGTLIGLSKRAGFVGSDGKMPRMGRALSADAGATIAGALLGTSTTTSYVESAAGVEAGGRTGLTSVVTGLCFLVALFFTPIILVIPAVAITPALILVGLFMMQGLSEMDFDDFPLMAPGILTMILIPLTFSITEGIGLGLLIYVVIESVRGNWRSVPALTWVMALCFTCFFALR
jgi:AGZA family xanthine/uracil permease-like MFS transporter